MAPVPSALELRNITAGYGRFTALHDLSLCVPAGATLALLGANGAGKSTTLRVTSGLVAPRAGQVLLHGQPVTGLPPWELARKGLGHVPEGRGIFPGLTVERNLALTGYANPGAAPGLSSEVAQLFPRLTERLDQRAGTLSGGEQQMLAVARALETKPSVLLLDELSLGLAPILVQQLFEVIAEIKRGGSTVVLVEQFVGPALRLADLAAILVKGRLVFFGEPGELTHGESGELFASYLGEGAAGTPASTKAAPVQPQGRESAPGHRTMGQARRRSKPITPVRRGKRSGASDSSVIDDMGDR